MGTPPNTSAQRLDIYKLAVEMADRVSARRGTANALFVTLNAALATTAAALKAENDWAAPTAGLLLCSAWWLLLRSYRELSAAKFNILHDPVRLPASPFTDEWDALKRRTGPLQYAEQGAVERPPSDFRLGLHRCVDRPLSPDPPIGRVGVLKSGSGRLGCGLVARESSA